MTQGLTDPSHSVPYLLQGGLGLPDHDYYLNTPQMEELLKISVMLRMLKLAGLSDASTRASEFSSWKQIAAVHALASSRKMCTRPFPGEGKVGYQGSGLDWQTFLDAAPKDVSEFIGIQAVAGLSALAMSEPLDAWKDWLAFHVVEQSSGSPAGFCGRVFQFFRQGP